MRDHMLDLMYKDEKAGWDQKKAWISLVFTEFYSHLTLSLDRKIMDLSKDGFLTFLEHWVVG